MTGLEWKSVAEGQELEQVEPSGVGCCKGGWC